MNPNVIQPEDFSFWEVLLLGLSALCSLGALILGGVGGKVYLETGVLPNGSWGYQFIVLALLGVVLYLAWIIIKKYPYIQSEAEK